MKPQLEPLPIDERLDQLITLARTSQTLVVCAPPGTGKTTRVPRALYDGGLARGGEILILEPRRIAARLAAARVADEMGEQAGETVGYTIRFENAAGDRTRIRFLTEGILARRIVQDPRLTGVSVVILDEFHERHLTTDLALAFLRQLQLGTRPDLKLLVMSATLDPGPVASFLGNAAVLSCEGKRFDVKIEYEEGDSRAPLHQRVAAGVSKLLKKGFDGGILVFLPGAAEIRLAMEAVRPIASRAGLTVLTLHGDMPAAAQARAVQPSDDRKLILATNVAESSVTIPGVTAVIDSGLARVAGHSSWTGLPVLALARISRASATQRAGRAGRLREGTVLRLYSRHDFETRPEFDVAEIKRADLAEAVLTLHGAGIHDVRSFSWFEPPANAALEAAEDLLIRLGALNNGALTDLGTQMLRFPLHPRLARLIVHSAGSGVGVEGCLLAALVSERGIRLDERNDFDRTRPGSRARANARSDLLELAESFRAAEDAGFEPGRIQALGLDPRAVGAVDRVRRQLERILPKGKARAAIPGQEEALLIAILAAFPDRVARRRAPGMTEFLLGSGGTAKLAESSVVHQEQLIVAVDAGDRTGAKGSRDSAGILIRLASGIEPEWLAGLFPGDLAGRRSLVWNEQARRADEVDQTLYRDLVLEETVRPPAPSEAVSSLLFSVAKTRGLDWFQDGDRVSSLRERVALLAAHFPAAEILPFGEEQICAAQAACCAGKRSLAELAHTSIQDALLNLLTPIQRNLLARETPERIVLPGGRKLIVHYEPGKPPWIESALQDFFGMNSTPAICAGRVALTVHLLAPSRRPLQVTQDLPGFWARHYPTLRREMQRRYPKHRWP